MIDLGSRSIQSTGMLSVLRISSQEKDLYTALVWTGKSEEYNENCFLSFEALLVNIP